MCGRGRPHDSRPGGRRYIPATFLPLQIQAVTALLVVGDEEAEVAEVLAGGSASSATFTNKSIPANWVRRPAIRPALSSRNVRSHSTISPCPTATSAPGAIGREIVMTRWSFANSRSTTRPEVRIPPATNATRGLNSRDASGMDLVIFPRKLDIVRVDVEPQSARANTNSIAANMARIPYPMRMDLIFE